MKCIAFLTRLSSLVSSIYHIHVRAAFFRTIIEVDYIFLLLNPHLMIISSILSLLRYPSHYAIIKSSDAQLLPRPSFLSISIDKVAGGFESVISAISYHPSLSPILSLSLLLPQQVSIYSCFIHHF